MKQSANILGTEYKIVFVPSLNERGGETDYYTKTIKISELEGIPESELTENKQEFQKHILRHELVHAFLFESGLDANSGSSEAWASNEEMVDWVAIQIPKIMAVYEKVVNCESIECTHLDGRKKTISLNDTGNYDMT